MAQEKVKFYFTFFFAIRGDESRTFSTSNILKVLKDIPKETFENIFKGSYNRNDIYVKKTSSRKKKIKNYL